MKNIIFEQNDYGNLEIDNTEKDTILIWDVFDGDKQVIFIQRERLSDFVNLLKKCNGEKIAEWVKTGITNNK